MSTLVEIEAAADALPLEQKQELLRFLASRVNGARQDQNSNDLATSSAKFSEFIGMADDLPADLAENLDHYLHGHPKK